LGTALHERRGVRGWRRPRTECLDRLRWTSPKTNPSAPLGATSNLKVWPNFLVGRRQFQRIGQAYLQGVGESQTQPSGMHAHVGGVSVGARTLARCACLIGGVQAEYVPPSTSPSCFLVVVVVADLILLVNTYDCATTSSLFPPFSTEEGMRAGHCFRTEARNLTNLSEPRYISFFAPSPPPITSRKSCCLIDELEGAGNEEGWRAAC
jgi:hypothetical protein